jgi:hypothetical protein
MRLAAGMAAMMLWAGPAAARPTDLELFCHDLGRVVDAAGEEGGFDHLQRSRAAPPTLGFERGCQGHGGAEGGSWFCHQSLAPADLSRDSLEHKTAACLTEAVREPGRWPSLSVSFALPNARITIEESGGPGAHVGRIVTFIVEAVPRHRLGGDGGE